MRVMNGRREGWGRGEVAREGRDGTQRSIIF